MKMVSVNQLYKSFDQIEAVKDLSFNVSKGEVFGLLGPNGAGKTTTITMIVGMQDPTSGTIDAAGRNAATEPAEAAALRIMLYHNALVEARFFSVHL